MDVRERTLVSIADSHLRRCTADVLEAKDAVNRARAEGNLLNEEALRDSDGKFTHEPEIRRDVRALLAKVMRSGTRFHGAAEVLDENLERFIGVAVSMVKMLEEQSKADAALAKHSLAQAVAERDAMRRKNDDERSEERVRAKLELERLSSLLGQTSQDGRCCLAVLAREMRSMEADFCNQAQLLALEMRLQREGFEKQIRELTIEHARQLDEASAARDEVVAMKNRLQENLEASEATGEERVAQLTEENRRLRESRDASEHQLITQAALFKETLTGEQKKSAEAVEALKNEKDRVIDALDREVARLRHVQEEVLKSQRESPAKARQMLFFESLKHKEMPSETLSWRGQLDQLSDRASGKARAKRATSAEHPLAPKPPRGGSSVIKASPRYGKVAGQATGGERRTCTMLVASDGSVLKLEGPGKAATPSPRYPGAGLSAAGAEPEGILRRPALNGVHETRPVDWRPETPRAASGLRVPT